MSSDNRYTDFHVNDDIMVYVENDCGSFTFEPAKIAAHSSDDCVIINWYYHSQTDCVILNPKLYKPLNNVVTKLCIKKVLILDVHDTQTVHIKSINNKLKITDDINEWRNSKYDFYLAFIEDVVDEKEPMLRKLTPSNIYRKTEHKESKSSSEDNDCDEEIKYKIKYTTNNPSIYNNTVFDRVKHYNKVKEIKNMNKKGIIPSFDLTAEDDIEQQHVIPKQTVAKQTPNVTLHHDLEYESNTESKRKKKRNKKKKKKTKTKQRRIYKKKSKCLYKQYINEDITSNPIYQQLKENASPRYPYPVRETDHRTTPREPVMLAIFVLWDKFGRDDILYDVTPFRCEYDFCRVNLWKNCQTIFINPPWSRPWFYILEAIKFVKYSNTNIAVLLLCRGSNKRWWKELISGFSILTIDISSIIFGGYQRKCPMITSLIFMINMKEKTDYLKIGIDGNVDVEEWSQKMQKNEELWKWLENKYEKEFVELDIDLITEDE